jgi:RNA polymerase sigma factor (sigma-70 family)
VSLATNGESCHVLVMSGSGPPRASIETAPPMASGERLAEGSLERCVQGLRRYFARRIAASEIDDAVQEVFLRMHGQVNGTRIEHLDRYLFTIAASVLSDQARRRAVRQGAYHETIEESHHPAEERTPERVLLDREALAVIVRAIEEMPPRTRDVFALHRFEEMSGPAIARHLGISVSAVEKHIMRALRLLHERLEAD